MNHKLRGIQTAVPCITTSWPDVWYHEGQRIFSSGSDHSRKRETIFNTIDKAPIKKDGMSKVRTILSCVYCMIYRVCLLTLCGTSENATDISYLLKLAKISISTNWDSTFIQNPKYNELHKHNGQNSKVYYPRKIVHAKDGHTNSTAKTLSKLPRATPRVETRVSHINKPCLNTRCNMWLL